MINSLKYVLVCLLAVAASSQSFGWGTKGHETIEEASVRIMPPSIFQRFLKNNMKTLRFLSMTPDLGWKHGQEPHPLEGQAHFFQMDFYSPRGGALNPNIGFYMERAGSTDVLLKKGTAPWRVEQLSMLLAQAFRRKKVDPTEVLQIASTLGHYVGDIGNPLHVAKDYDGQLIGEKGLHSFFETVTVNEIPDDLLLDAVTKAAAVIGTKVPDNLRPIAGAFNLAKAANIQSNIVLEVAQRTGQSPTTQQKFRPIIVNTLAMSTAILAKIWNQAYMMAGSPEFSTANLGKIPIPDWIPVNYIPGVRGR